MPVPSGLSNEDAKDFVNRRTAEVVENLAPAAQVLDHIRETIFPYRKDLIAEIRKTEERLNYLNQQRVEVDNFLAENQLAAEDADLDDVEDKWPGR